MRVKNTEFKEKFINLIGRGTPAGQLQIGNRFGRFRPRVDANEAKMMDHVLELDEGARSSRLLRFRESDFSTCHILFNFIKTQKKIKKLHEE